jgi:hypothetical protein
LQWSGNIIRNQYYRRSELNIGTSDEQSFHGAVEKVAGGRQWCVQPLNNLAKKNMSRYRAVRLNDGILESESLQMSNYMAE